MANAIDATDWAEAAFDEYERLISPEEMAAIIAEAALKSPLLTQNNAFLRKLMRNG